MESTESQFKLILPNNIVPLDCQLGGHRKGKEFGVFKELGTGHVLKTAGDKRQEKEAKFYQSIWSLKESNLHKFMCKFYGDCSIEGMKFLRLADITDGFDKPSTMDVKIGPITYEPDADSLKKARSLKKYKWINVLGFRICGIRIYDYCSNNWLYKDKEFGKKLTPNDIVEIFDMFTKSNIFNQEKLINQYLHKLYLIHNWFTKENINYLKFISSSLFFLHSFDGHSVKSDVKMIDFPHVLPNVPSDPKERLLDDNYLFGLNKLIEKFELLKKKLLAKWQKNGNE